MMSFKIFACAAVASIGSAAGQLRGVSDLDEETSLVQPLSPKQRLIAQKRRNNRITKQRTADRKAFDEDFAQRMALAQELNGKVDETTAERDELRNKKRTFDQMSKPAGGTNTIWSMMKGAYSGVANWFGGIKRRFFKAKRPETSTSTAHSSGKAVEMMAMGQPVSLVGPPIDDTSVVVEERSAKRRKGPSGGRVSSDSSDSGSDALEDARAELDDVMAQHQEIVGVMGMSVDEEDQDFTEDEKEMLRNELGIHIPAERASFKGIDLDLAYRLAQLHGISLGEQITRILTGDLGPTSVERERLKKLIAKLGPPPSLTDVEKFKAELTALEREAAIEQCVGAGVDATDADEKLEAYVREGKSLPLAVTMILDKFYLQKCIDHGVLEADAKRLFMEKLKSGTAAQAAAKMIIDEHHLQRCIAAGIPQAEAREKFMAQLKLNPDKPAESAEHVLREAAISKLLRNRIPQAEQQLTEKMETGMTAMEAATVIVSDRFRVPTNADMQIDSNMFQTSVG